MLGGLEERHTIEPQQHCQTRGQVQFQVQEQVSSSCLEPGEPAVVGTTELQQRSQEPARELFQEREGITSFYQVRPKQSAVAGTTEPRRQIRGLVRLCQEQAEVQLEQRLWRR